MRWCVIFFALIFRLVPTPDETEEDEKKRLNDPGGLFVRRCFFEKVHLGDDHPSATVPLNIEIIEDLLWRLFRFFTGSDRFFVLIAPFLVFVIGRCNDLSAGKTSNRDNHHITCMISASSFEHHAQEASYFL